MSDEKFDIEKEVNHLYENGVAEAQAYAKLECGKGMDLAHECLYGKQRIVTAFNVQQKRIAELEAENEKLLGFIDKDCDTCKYDKDEYRFTVSRDCMDDDDLKWELRE